MNAVNDRARTLLPIAALLVLGAVMALADVMSGHSARILHRFPGVDKPTHFLLYLAVFLALYHALPRLAPALRGDRRWMLAAAAALALSLLEETHQLLIAGRSFELLDMIANAAGIATGAAWVSLRGKPRTAGILAGLAVLGAVTWLSWHDTHHYFAGLQLQREGRYPEARARFFLAEKPGRENPDLDNEIAWITLEHIGDDPALGLRYARRAFESRPDNADILDTYGWALLVNGHHDEALRRLLQAYTLDPGIYCIHYHLGMAYLRLGDVAGARREFEAQIASHSDERYAERARTALNDLGKP